MNQQNPSPAAHSAVTQWMLEDSAALAERLAELGQFATQEEAVSGYGMKSKVIRLIGFLRTAMYPAVFCGQELRREFLTTVIRDNLQQGAMLLYEMCRDVLCSTCRSGGKDGEACDRCRGKAGEITVRFMGSLEEIAALLRTDIRAAYEGDPAARSEEEILLAYPAFEAISIFRLAHRLFELEVPLLPRMMTEHAHQLTGIDIHPGATIGDHFFIDHGTGVVIGETCVIGSHVKLYQGVTLGAKSFQNDENGNPVKGIKRHPNIGSHVVVYAGATILGGDTYIGDNCVIGGNVWLTHSVEAGSVVYNQLGRSGGQ